MQCTIDSGKYSPKALAAGGGDDKKDDKKKDEKKKGLYII
jgi:hypothetical protein